MLKYDEESLGSIDELREKADRFMLYMLWGHVPVAGFIAPYAYGTWQEGLIASLIICMIGTLSYVFCRGSFGHRVLNGLLLVSYSVVLISVQYGRIEMHFHVFFALPILILYRDWRVIPPASALVALHHGIFNYCQTNSIELFGFPLVVFNYGNGWDIVFLHAIFVVFQSTVLIYYSNLLKKQYFDILEANKNLEVLVEKRTLSLSKEKEKIEAYKKTLDQVAGTVAFDLNGKITEVNDYYEKISGFKRSELVGSEHAAICLSNQSTNTFKRMWNTVISGNVWRSEVECYRKDGSPFWVEAAVAPLKSSAGEITKVMAIKYDITERKKQESTILSQREQIVAQSKLSSLGEMAGGIAHEINNPLAVISTTMKTIRKMIAKDMVGTEHFNRALDDIDDTVVRITKIVSGLRNVSRDTDGESFDLCTIEDVINDVLPLCSERFKNNGIDLKVIVEDEVKGLKYKIMRVQISQVLINLLTNAFDEIVDDEGERWVNLHASISVESNMLNIQVTDSGKGVPVEIQDKIFQPFFTTKDIGKGTGLGLSLSYSIILKHKGKLFIDNRSDHSCFVIQLPM